MKCALALLLVGCSNSPTNIDDAAADAAKADVVEAGTTDAVIMDAAQDADADSTDDAGGDAGCNALKVPPASTAHLSGAMVPTAMGGAIAIGLYHLTDVTWFNGQNGTFPGGYTSAFDFKGGGTFDEIFDENSNTPLTYDRSSGTYATKSTTLDLTYTCAGGFKTGVGYTATSSEIRMYAMESGYPIEFVFAKQ